MKRPWIIPRGWPLAGLAALSLLATGLVACGHQRVSADASPPAYTATTTAAAEEVHPSLFRVPLNQLAHLQIVTVAPTTLERTLQLPGTVEYNQFRTTPVLSPVGGPVMRIFAVPGENVRAGQTLLLIRSPDYSQARAAYLKAQSAAHLAKMQERRDEDLFGHHAIAQQDLQQAEANSVQAQADLDNAQAALRVLGIPPATAAAQTSPVLPVTAPISGLIVARSVAPGQLVQAGTQVFTISDLHTVWVDVHVYQQQLAHIARGEAVEIKTSAYPGRVFRGRISYIGATLDPQTRTLRARIVTANPGELLKNQMYVTAIVQAGTIHNAIALPDSAVLRDSVNHPFVYVATSRPGQFARRLVDIGVSQDGRTHILDGLKPGDRVVGDGALFVQFANELQD